MKKKVIITVFLFLVCGAIFMIKAEETGGTPSDQGSPTLVSTPDLYNLVVKWAEEYNKVQKGEKLMVKTLPAPTSAGIQTEKNSLVFISENYFKNLKSSEEWHVVVGRDAVVPVINSTNPLLNTIKEKGIAPQKLALAVSNPASANWGIILGTDAVTAVTLYLPDNGHIAGIVAGFMNLPPGRIKYVSVAGEKEVVAAVQKDPNGIGFARMINILDESGQGLPEKVELMPIDKNGNGKLDYAENIYSDLQSFLRGVWIGKYPHALSERIYTVAAALPENKAEIDFLTWVLTSGQIYLNEAGYFDLVSGDRQSGLDMLTPEPMAITQGKGFSAFGIVALTLGLLMVIGIIVGILASYIRGRKKAVAELRHASSGVLDETIVKALDGLYFDRSHTWSFMEKSGQVRVGVDDFLQHVTGPITCIKMKKAGEKVSRGEVFLSVVQDGKRLNIKSPVSGTVKDHNDLLIMNSALVNTSPYAEGWIYLIEPENWLKEIQSLLMADTYKTWLRAEFTRLKDFLASSLKEHRLELSAVALQDGGPLQDNVLAGLGPEVWDDFQTQFLDRSI